MAQFTATSPEGMVYHVETPAMVKPEIIQQHIQQIDSQFKSADLPADFIEQNESAGGQKTYNPKSGAEGDMQTLPKTLKDPGFGVTPAKDNSPQELHRVGVDYWNAMKQKYHNTLHAAAAYNWGPGNVDALLKQNAFHMSKLPAETQGYIKKLFKQFQSTLK